MLNLILSYLILFAPPTPFGLKIDKIYENPPHLPGYRALLDRSKSAVVYVESLENKTEFETEVQIYFAKNRITKILYIYGPRGLDGDNCLSFYKDLIKDLNQKYGPYKNRLEVKDPILDDLVLGNLCTHIRIGGYSVTTTWVPKHSTINAFLFGDDTGFYVEVEYTFGASRNKLKSSNPFKNL